jgi:hypothetical protein|tara:strand:+ start:386 stop:991 length:606 start_codon:yes stop_codon:yes gene_type:complete
MAIERIKYEPTYITNKFEFYYDSYDDENRYSNYEFDYVREGVEYMIIYTTSKEEIYMDVIRNEAMVKVENPTIFDQYSIIQNSSRELYLKSYILVLTDIMRKKGSVIRYFAKSKLDKYDRIFEINKLDYNSEANFYDTVSLIWQLKGSKENILMKNEGSLELAEGPLPGIQNFLDPLEFYEEEMTPYEEIQEKLGRLQTGY